MSRDPLYAVLVENNPYDRAVIDAALAGDQRVALRYTLPDARAWLDLDSHLWKECLPATKPRPDVVLLDLALSAKSEEELSKAGFQHELKEERGNIKALIAQLEKEANNMVPVVRANHWLCQALSDDGPSRAVALSRLVNEERSDEVRQRVQPAIESFKASGAAPPGKIETALLQLWGGRQLIADVARLISRAPSLWGTLLCIAQNPDVCFFIVSHYAGPMIQEPLKDILAARTDPPSSNTDFYASFIISKAELHNLGDHLFAGHEKWAKLRSHNSISRPFELYPVLTPDGKSLAFHEVIQQWRDDHTAEDFSPMDTLLWDASGTLDGGTARWEAIVKTWGLSPAVLQQRLSTARAPHNNVLVVEPSPLISPQDVDKWARSVKGLLAAQRKSKNETILVVRGTQNAYAAAANQLSDTVAKYRIPSFHDPAFSKVLPLQNLIDHLGIFLVNNTFHIHRWSDLPGQYSDERPLMNLLRNYTHDAPGAAERIRDRIVCYLVRKSKSDSVSLEPLFEMLERMLSELRSTEGTNQDWEGICNNVGLEKCPDKNDSVW